MSELQSPLKDKTKYGVTLILYFLTWTLTTIPNPSTEEHTSNIFRWWGIVCQRSDRHESLLSVDNADRNLFLYKSDYSDDPEYQTSNHDVSYVLFPFPLFLCFQTHWLQIVLHVFSAIFFKLTTSTDGLEELKDIVDVVLKQHWWTEDIISCHCYKPRKTATNRQIMELLTHVWRYIHYMKSTGSSISRISTRS